MVRLGNWWAGCLLAAATIAGPALRAADTERMRSDPPWAPRYPEVLFHRGDDVRWAARDLDESGWQRISGRELPSRDGIYWVRWRVPQPQSAPARRLDGLMLRVVASYDLYWDGHLVGRNGKVGASAEAEEPGAVDALFQLPPELLGPGEHVIALRLSSFHTGFRGPTYGVNVEWGNFRAMLLQRSRATILSVMAVGGALVVTVVFGLMWLLAGRRLPLLLFSVMFLSVALMQALQAWRWLFDYPYSWHFPRLVVITALVTVMSVLLPAFVLHHFRVGRARWVYAWLAVILTAAWFSSEIYNAISLTVCAAGFATALALTGRAAWQRKRGGAFAFAGLAVSVVSLVLAPRDFLEHAFFISAGPAVLGLLVALVLQLRDERREAQQAKLTAARLEIELLKKNIQPHFVLNTLATIMEVIEQEPRAAVALIEALASEFRILNRVSGEKLIALGQELELCRAHLHVMSLRKGARCVLQVRGADEQALVPPALFLTLIENGLTHLLPREGRHEFVLTAEYRGGVARYALLAGGVRHPSAGPAAAGSEGEAASGRRGAADADAPVGMGKEAETPGGPREGTGLRYIKARLEESFTGRWSVSGGAVPEGWETVIEIGPLRPASEARRALADPGFSEERLA